MLQYWIFPRRGRLVLTVDQETAERIGRHDRIFWVEPSGVIETWGTVRYRMLPGDAGPERPKVRVRPRVVQVPIERSELEQVLGKKLLEARREPGRLLALDRAPGDSIVRLAARKPRGLTTRVLQFTARKSAAVGRMSVDLGKSMWDYTSRKSLAVGRSVRDSVASVFRAPGAEEKPEAAKDDEEAAPREPAPPREGDESSIWEAEELKESAPEGAEAAAGERPTCWIVCRQASGAREERLVAKEIFDEIEAGGRVLWLEDDGGIEGWGQVLARTGWGDQRKRHTVTVYWRPLTQPIEAAEVRKILGSELPAVERRIESPETAKELHRRTRTTSVSFQEAFREELEVIYGLRQLRKYPQRRNPEGVVFHQAHSSQLAGLAFSGGGIRSATFNLGILQGLARKGLLGGFDYLSTVSGGGYIGSWLVAWIKRSGLAQVEDKLRSEQPPVRRDEPLSAAERWSPITFLRQYSNFLSPSLGLFSADSWTIFATYARNLVLNLLVLVTALAALLLVPRLAVVASAFFPRGEGLFSHATLLVIALAGLGTGVSFLFANVMALSDFTGRARSPRDADSESEGGKPAGTRKVQLTVVAPLFIAAWAASCWIWLSSRPEPDWSPLPWILSGATGLLGWLSALLPSRLSDALGSGFGTLVQSYDWAIWVAVSAGLYPLLWLLVTLVYWFRSEGGWWSTARAKQSFLLVSRACAAGAGGGLLLWWFASLLVRQTHEAFALMVIWGPPLLVLDLVLTAVLHIGLMGREFPEDHRQWWSRLGAWLFIACLAWLGFFSLALYGPVAVEWLARKGMAAAGGMSLGWVLSTAAGIWAAGRSKNGNGGNGKRLALLVHVTPYVFVAGLLALLAYAIQKTMAGLLAAPARPGDGFDDLLRGQLAATWHETGWLFILGLIVALAALGSLSTWLSSRIDLNEFSMHLFYRNRLIRAYLGASRRRRDAHPFTGFDPKDDVDLHTLVPPGFVCDPQAAAVHGEASEVTYDGPYPIVNTALNLTAGGELAWQERLAASYSFAPLFYGFDTGLEATDENLAEKTRPRCEPFAYRCSGLANHRQGVTLGTALTVSGAAVSPNMGHQSSPPLAFLLTVFNARLGLWQGNPKRVDTWSNPGPKRGLFYLLAELFGYTNADSQYVNLSDGGFFDNMGLYELVRRRCRFIVVCDAEADPKLEFAGLGAAIRKCRADFGVDIEIHVDPIREQKGGRFSDWHCAVGSIRYPDERSPRGTLVYIKASLTGDEPEDVLDYAVLHPGFPHESTADQFFDESQFESYRSLGLHVAESVFGPVELEEARAPVPAADGGSYVRLEPVFVDLRQAWYPKSKAVKESFTRHTGLLVKVFERLRGQQTLAYLVPQVYMELRDWRRGRPVLAGTQPQRADWHPQAPEELTPQEFRDGFFLCNSVIQLMENVYQDLDLEGEWRHPDNRGWKNLFRHWSWSWMFRLTWAVSASTYGARFQKFCERRLFLDPGTVWATPIARKTSEWEEKLSDFERHLIIRTHRECGLRPSETEVLALRVLVLEPRAAFQRMQRERQWRSPLDEPALEERRFEFSFGFVLVQPEPDSRGGPDKRGLIFLRVRDHLRSLGLGRRALEHLILHYNLTWSDSPPRNEDLRRVSPELDILRLSDMYKSVRNELEPVLLKRSRERPA